MAGLVSQAQVRPGEDILGTLVREHRETLTTDELIWISELLLAAGHETTSNMIGLGALALLRHPEQLALTRDEGTAIAPVVEERLRFLSVVSTGKTRTALSDVELDGVTIPKGSMVIVAMAAGNRDPRFIGDGDRLDVTRDASGHVAFGHGHHHCLGAPLARVEMRIALPALLRRFPGLALAVPYEDVPFREHHFVHGPNTLPVRW